MFTHDPFQAYQTLAAFGGAPYGVPYQQGNNPLALAMQPVAYQGIGGYSPYPQPVVGWPQQPQSYGQQMQGWNPLAAGLQNPVQQHQLGHHALQSQLQNPLQTQFQNPLQNPLLNPQINAILAYQAWQQQLAPLQYPLAPQSFIGGAGIGQQFGQINPQLNPQINPQLNALPQFALRQGSFGLSPFAGY